MLKIAQQETINPY